MKKEIVREIKVTVKIQSSWEKNRLQWILRIQLPIRPAGITIRGNVEHEFNFVLTASNCSAILFDSSIGSPAATVGETSGTFSAVDAGEPTELMSFVCLFCFSLFFFFGASIIWKLRVHFEIICSETHETKNLLIWILFVCFHKIVRRNAISE